MLRYKYKKNIHYKFLSPKKKYKLWKKKSKIALYYITTSSNYKDLWQLTAEWNKKYYEEILLQKIIWCRVNWLKIRRYIPVVKIERGKGLYFKTLKWEKSKSKGFWLSNDVYKDLVLHREGYWKKDALKQRKKWLCRIKTLIKGKRIKFSTEMLKMGKLVWSEKKDKKWKKAMPYIWAKVLRKTEYQLRDYDGVNIHSYHPIKYFWWHTYNRIVKELIKYYYSDNTKIIKLVRKTIELLKHIKELKNYYKEKKLNLKWYEKLDVNRPWRDKHYYPKYEIKKELNLIKGNTGKELLKTQIGRLMLIGLDIWGESKGYKLNSTLKEWIGIEWKKDQMLNKYGYMKYLYAKVLKENAYGAIFDMEYNDERRFIAPEYRRWNPSITAIGYFGEYTKLRNTWKVQAIYNRFKYLGGLKLYNKQYAKYLELNHKEQEHRPYNIKKNPKFFSSNTIIHLYNVLLKNKKEKKELIQAKAYHKRIRQVLSKLILPFYGNINFRQFKKLFKKIRGIKSLNNSKEELLLSMLENRVDVIVYRLNLAPTLAWARDFIRNGGLYISIENESWIKNYLKDIYIDYPLSLRKPMYVKNKTIFEVFNDVSWKWLKKFKNVKCFMMPITDPNYVVKNGTIIQTSPYYMCQYKKLQELLLYKPIPNHLYTLWVGKTWWIWFRKAYKKVEGNIWQRNLYGSYITAIMLGLPKWKNYKDEKGKRITNQNFKYLCLS